jgi:hypothetical protein
MTREYLSIKLTSFSLGITCLMDAAPFLIAEEILGLGLVPRLNLSLLLPIL